MKPLSCSNLATTMSGGLGLLDTLKRKLVENKAEVEKWKKTVEEASWKIKETHGVKSSDEKEVSKLKEKREECEEEVAKNKGEALRLLHQIENVEREVEDLVRSKRAQEEKRSTEEGRLKKMELQLMERKVQLLKTSDAQNQMGARMVKMDAVLASTVAKAEAVEEAAEKLELELNIIGGDLQSIERTGDSVNRQQAFEDKMAKILVQCCQNEANAKNATKALVILEEEVNRLEGVLKGARTTSVQIEQEMEEAVRGLRNM